MNLHIVLSLTACFLLGVSWRLFARASKAYRSKLRSYPSRWAFVKDNWDVFLLRTAFSGAAFALWLFHPDYMAKGLIYFHVPGSFANWLIVTPNLLSSFGFGFLSDYGLDQIQIKLAIVDLPKWLPEAIKGEIPSYDQNVVNGAAFTQVNKRDSGAS